MDAYDVLPYDRLSVRETHPDHLAVLARLYGVASPDPDTARVLELGCAEGANLIPMAWYMPRAHFVGLDLSSQQIQTGQTQIDSLGLGNIELQCADVAEANLDDIGFDYIIAHGLYSWVPEDVRSALLDLIRRQLRPGGVAYLSFNALPGWHMRGMLREMLLFHVRTLNAPLQRVNAAREFLGFLETGLYGLDALSSQYLMHEMEELRQAPDSYLYHEYLAAVNEPVLFSDFVARAGAAGLRYLCNAELHYQFPASLGEGAEQALAALDNPLQRQQYLDFLINRNFHQALLVRDDTASINEPDYEAFSALALYADLAAPRKIDLRKTKPQSFTDMSGEAHAVSHPLTKAALAQLTRVYPQAVNYRELELSARTQVANAGDKRLADQTDHLFGELFYLFISGTIGASSHAGGAIPNPQEPLQATPLASLEARFGRVVDSRHRRLMLDETSARLIAMLDGSRERMALAAKLAANGSKNSANDLAALELLLKRRGVLLG